jgi:hypothetical protein
MPTDRLSFRDGYQFAWDSTSLTTFKECARKYYYKIVLGYSTRERSVHLDFGIALHSAYEYYHRCAAQGIDHEAALRDTVKQTLIDTAGWNPDDNYKNRKTLIRTIVWYLDERKDDPTQTVILANGKPAVELSFRFEIPNTDFLYCGHMDRIASYQNDLYVFDYKSTKRALYTEYFDQFSPHNQMTGYTVGAKVTFHQPVKGVMIDAAQVGVGFSRFARGLAPRPDAVLDEWLSELAYWVKLAHGYAQADFWPMNESSCDKYFGCEFRRVCAKSPAQRKTWLEADYTKRLWDPLQIRGDI